MGGSTNEVKWTHEGVLQTAGVKSQRITSNYRWGPWQVQHNLTITSQSSGWCWLTFHTEEAQDQQWCIQTHPKNTYLHQILFFFDVFITHSLVTFYLFCLFLYWTSWMQQRELHTHLCFVSGLDHITVTHTIFSFTFLRIVFYCILSFSIITHRGIIIHTGPGRSLIRILYILLP